MALFKKSKSKSPPLSPGRKLFLFIWTSIVVFFAIVIFAKAGPRVLMAGVILSGVIGGLLFGLKLLRKVDETLVALGLAAPAGNSQDASGRTRPDLENVVAFLRMYRKKGQFSRQDFARYCHDQNFNLDPLLRIMTDKGWVAERQNAFLITSKGEELIQQSL